jgi:hypothetical protein
MRGIRAAPANVRGAAVWTSFSLCLSDAFAGDAVDLADLGEGAELAAVEFVALEAGDSLFGDVEGDGEFGSGRVAVEERDQLPPLAGEPVISSTM